jgi:hypothetical protein
VLLHRHAEPNQCKDVTKQWLELIQACQHFQIS